MLPMVSLSSCEQYCHSSRVLEHNSNWPRQSWASRLNSRWAEAILNLNSFQSICAANYIVDNSYPILFYHHGCIPGLEEVWILYQLPPWLLHLFSNPHLCFYFSLADISQQSQKTSEISQHRTIYAVRKGWRLIPIPLQPVHFWTFECDKPHICRTEIYCPLIKFVSRSQ